MKHQSEHDAHVAAVTARIAAIPASDHRGRFLAAAAPIIDKGLEILDDPTLDPSDKVELVREALNELRHKGLHQIADQIF
jgi:hypothetical protein